ncbi:MAG: ABC transporter ATP-binding protein [Spirochaetales bacterium]|nr:ABC transporter ATP-binding protein [Spirochaetales bacterium]
MILGVDGITFRYNSHPVLEDITFEVHTHQITAVLGPNGAGKTTLLRCINRILKPESGTVRIEERDLAHSSSREIARRVAYVAQRSEPRRISAFDAVLLGRKPHIGWDVSRHDLEMTQATLKRLDLEHLSLRYTDRMSGGEYQKVCIARAVVQEPTVMLLDEPTASLDLKNQLAILRLLRTIVRGHRMCAVITMHDLNTAFRYADNFLFLKNGRIYAAVDRSEISGAIVEEVYGVPVAVQWHQDHPVVLPLDDDED